MSQGVDISYLRERVVDGDNGCWLWQGAISNGYGRLMIRGESWYAHRLAVTVTTGPIPEGLHVDHLCRVRRCCNPAHLEVVTQAENNRRNGLTGVAAVHAAMTCCTHGHPLRPTEGRQRTCMVCARKRGREWARTNRQRRRVA